MPKRKIFYPFLAAEAKSGQLVTDVFPESSFEAEVDKRVRQLARSPPQTMVYTKRLIRQSERDILHTINRAECDRLLERWQSEECFKAIAAFMQRKHNH